MITITINTDSASFAEHRSGEVRRLLSYLEVWCLDHEGLNGDIGSMNGLTLVDRDGNVVGEVIDTG